MSDEPLNARKQFRKNHAPNLKSVNETEPPRNGGFVFLMDEAGRASAVEALVMQALDEQARQVYTNNSFGGNNEAIEPSLSTATALYEAIQARKYSEIVGGSVEPIEEPQCPNVEIVGTDEASDMGLTCAPTPLDLEDYKKWLIIRVDRARFKGDKGEQGEQGQQGQPGEPGQPGAKGDKGDTGAQGQTGAQGEQGEPGQPGQDGKGVPPIEFQDKPGQPPVEYTPIPPDQIQACLAKLELVFQDNGIKIPMLPPGFDLRYSDQNSTEIKGGIDAALSFYIKNSSQQWPAGSGGTSPDIKVVWVSLGFWCMNFGDVQLPSEIADAIAGVISGALENPSLYLVDTNQTLNPPVSGTLGASGAGVTIGVNYWRNSVVELEDYDQLTQIKLNARIADWAGYYWRWVKKIPDETGLQISLNCFRIEQLAECALYLNPGNLYSWNRFNFGLCWQPGAAIEGERPGFYTMLCDHRPIQYLGQVFLQTPSKVSATLWRTRNLRVKIITNVKEWFGTNKPILSVYDNLAGDFKFNGNMTLVHDEPENYVWEAYLPYWTAVQADTFLHTDGARYYSGNLTINFGGGTIIGGYVIRAVQFFPEA